MQVAGPTTIFRFENPETKQIIYLFGEYHIPLTEQRECPISDESLRIDQLLKKVFRKNKKEKINFFLETDIDYNSHYKSINTYSLSYIDTLRNLFSDNVSFNNNNKVIRSKHFSNVYFHHFDVRGEELSKIYILNQTRIYNYNENKQKVLNVIDELINRPNKYLSKIVSKKYESKSLQTIIHNIYNDVIIFLKNIYKELNELSVEDEVFKVLEKKKFKTSNTVMLLKYILPFEVKVSNMITIVGYAIAIVNDLYLIRRLLTKNTFPLNFIYGGNAHIINIAMFLQKYSNYKITASNQYTNNYVEKNADKYNVEWIVNNMNLLLTNISGSNHMFEYVQQCVKYSDEFPELLYV